jgi:hypothetical protein
VEPANEGETEVLINYIEAVKSYKTPVLLSEEVFCVSWVTMLRLFSIAFALMMKQTW